MKHPLSAEQIANTYKPDWYWRGRSLENYVAMHRKQAEGQGVLSQLLAAKTLTAARKIMYGYKRGNVR